MLLDHKLKQIVEAALLAARRNHDEVMMEDFVEVHGDRSFADDPAGGQPIGREGVAVALAQGLAAQAKASGKNLRSAVEATVRSVKHPYRNGKVPVRGQPRVTMLLIGSAAMTNVRRICRYLQDKNKPDSHKKSRKSPSENPAFQCFYRILHFFSTFQAFSTLRPADPAFAY